MTMGLEISSRSDLTLEACRRVAWGGETVTLGPEAITKLTKAREEFLRLLDDPDITIYGVNTGYGHRAKERLTKQGRLAQAVFPTHHRAASWGDDLPQRVVRGIIFARLGNFLDGHAAVSPHVAQAVAAMLAHPALPSVPARGQGGAGEILSLSHLFMALAASVPLAEKDMLSLINGSPAASALIADAALSASPRLDMAMEVLALAAEAFNAPHGHFAVELETYWNNPHDAWALSTLRSLMEGGHDGPRRRYQAPVSIRILPRMLGLARQATANAELVARQSLMAVTDNPVVIPAHERQGADAVISTGGYHNAQAPAALDALVAAYANLIVLSGRIAAKLLDSSASLLPPLLGYPGSETYLGCLPMAIVGYEEEARLLAQPTLLPGSESGGFGADDVASPVFLAWKKFDRVGGLLEQSLATLAPIAMRALRITKRRVPHRLVELSKTIAERFPDNSTTVPFGADIGKLAEAFRTRIYDAGK
jgi:histidine ammonia-lyase